MCGSGTTACNMAWAIIIQHSDSVFIDSAGLYSWFQNYVQDCVETKNCQQRLVNIYNVGRLLFNHLNTIGSIETLTPAISNKYNEIKYAKDHLQATGYPWWATIGTYAESLDPVDTNTEPFPIREGWVAFGDSYAAGIGAGNRLQKDEDDNGCSRGTGSYPTILNEIVRFGHNVQPNFQMLACSGERAQQFLDGEKGKQIENWYPESSDLATCSFTGNDLGFGDIVSHCIMGYKSRTDCQKNIADAKNILDETEKITEWVFDVLDKIFGKVSQHKPRFIVYWTSYPQFFAVKDNTCDTCYFQELIWAGEYLKQALRNQLNELSIKVNDAIKQAITKYNVNREYPRAVLIAPDALGLYEGRRFCEFGVKETLKSEKDQATVAFFYDNGYDDIPSETEGFHMPAQHDGAPSGWSISSANSRTCTTGSTDDPRDDLLCDIAKAVENNTVGVQSAIDDAFNVTTNPDGSVTITDFAVRFNKMFHPKVRANWHIAQAVSDAFRRN